jgi:hypothetical protein
VALDAIGRHVARRGRGRIASTQAMAANEFNELVRFGSALASGANELAHTALDDTRHAASVRRSGVMIWR